MCLYEDLGHSHSFNGTQVMVLTLTVGGGAAEGESSVLTFTVRRTERSTVIWTGHIKTKKNTIEADERK